MKHYFLQCSYILEPHIHEHGNISVPGLLITSIAFAFYSLAAFIRWQDKKLWNKSRVMSFVAGCIVVGISFSPALVDYAHHDFRGHMIQHLLLGMLAPIGLVLGAPVLLALEIFPGKGARLLSNVLRNRIFHFISHPVTAAVLNTGSMFLLYLTPLYNRLHDNAGLYVLIHFHLLAAGYLFTWAMIGPDPAPRRPNLLPRVIVLFLSVAAHSYLSKFMFAYSYPRNSIHSEKEIQAAAKIMYYGGDIIELFLVVALFTLWYNKKGKPHYRFSAEMKGV